MVVLVAIGAAAHWGGWAWLPACLIALGAAWLRGGSGFVSANLVRTVGASLMWLGVYAITGDRRLYFPYTMQYAVQAGPLGGVAAAAVFFAIRIWQGAATEVLIVEAVVAVAVLALAYAARKRISLPVSALLASLLAFASLGI